MSIQLRDYLEKEEELSATSSIESSYESDFDMSVASAEASKSITAKILQLEAQVDNLDKLCLQTQAFIAARFESKNSLGVVLTMKQYRKLDAKRSHVLRTTQLLRLVRSKAEEGELLDYQAEMESVLNKPMMLSRHHHYCKQQVSNDDLLKEAYLLCNSNNSSLQ